MPGGSPGCGHQQDPAGNTTSAKVAHAPGDRSAADIDVAEERDRAVGDDRRSFRSTVHDPAAAQHLRVCRHAAQLPTRSGERSSRSAAMTDKATIRLVLLVSADGKVL